MRIEWDDHENIFIAGSSGMVGSAIKRELERLGFSEKNERKKLLCPKREQLNLLNFEELNLWFKQFNPSIVIIAAAKVGGIVANNENTYDFILENLKIQTNLIELSHIHKVKKLLFLGSSCIYPKLSSQPIKEEYLMTNSLEKTNEFYAVAKIAGIKLCQSLMIQYKFNAICLMPTNLYGPGDNYHEINSHVIPSLIRRFDEAKIKNLDKVTCWGTGNPLREFLYVDDLARACIFLLKNWDPVYYLNSEELRLTKNCIINVGSNDEVSIKELAKIIARKFNYGGEIIWNTEKPDGTPRKKLETSKINSLGWFPDIDLETGLDLTLESFRKEKEAKRVRY